MLSTGSSVSQSINQNAVPHPSSTKLFGEYYHTDEKKNLEEDLRQSSQMNHGELGRPSLPERPPLRKASAADHDELALTLEHANTQRTQMRHTSPICNLAFSTPGNVLASASDDGVVHVWGARTGRLVQTLHGHTGPISTSSFSRQGDRLASALADYTVQVWNIETGQEMQKLEGYGWTPRITFDPGVTQDTPDPQSYVSSAIPRNYISLRPIPQNIVVHNSWKEMNSTKAIWLAANYRYSCTVSQGRLVAFGYPSGTIMLLVLS